MMDSLEIFTENSHNDCSNKLLYLISSEINDSETFSIGLSGGSTPKYFYELLTEKYKEYSNIYLWTVDERQRREDAIIAKYKDSTNYNNESK